ncbi:MAG: YceI family protein [Verrucomicrobia bacterium]|nr:YceI family protein [Verrucomicrobiota bacterium]
MKKTCHLLLASILAVGLLASARAAVETYAIDPVHSSAVFSVRHMVSKFTGSFTKVTGTVTVDRDHMENSSVVASVDVGSVNTASEKRDNHLKSPDFFDLPKFPTMDFKSKSWKKTGDDTYDVTGDLTIKDVTKEVVLKVTALGFSPGMKPGTTASGWEATTTIKKSDFNLPGPAMLGKVLGDDVAVTLNVEANHQP